MKDDLKDFGQEAEWETIYDPKSFYPSRFEWIFSGILAGLLQGTHPRDHEKQIDHAIHLAQLAEKRLSEVSPTED